MIFGRTKKMAKAECKVYCKLLLCEKQTKGFDVVPTEDEVTAAEAEVSKTETDQNILKLINSTNRPTWS